MSSKRVSQPRPATIRKGFKYQDVVALEIFLDWLANPSKYQWVRVEANKSGVLDDVQACLSDDRLVVRQVKFAASVVNLNQVWTWEALLEKKDKARPRSTSLIQDWSGSLTKLKANHKIAEVGLFTNYGLSGNLFNAFDPASSRINYDEIDETVKIQLNTQIGSETAAREFFAEFLFQVKQPSLDGLDEANYRRFQRLGGTREGWLHLKDRLADWMENHDLPRDGGKITLEDIKIAALWISLRLLPQAYEVPLDYVLPSQEFHDQVIAQIKDSECRCIVVSGSPGSGKSTYMSYLYEYLVRHNIPTIRHHYYLSTSDSTSIERLEYQRVSEAMLHDLYYEHSIALGGNSSGNPVPERLRQWLTVCGTYYAARNQRLVIILDGLDHVWRNTHSVNDLRRLLVELLTPPSGTILIVATQMVADDQLPSELLTIAPRQDWKLIPTLTEAAVSEWINTHIDVFWREPDREIPDSIFNELTQALYAKSNGHPLYLRYALQYLRGLVETSISSVSIHQLISRLPDCPNNQIQDYYRALWRELSESGRALLFIMSLCPVPWPKNGIVSCLEHSGVSLPSAIEAFRTVNHLLEENLLGWQVFHSSLLVFLTSLPDYPQYEQRYQRHILTWFTQDSLVPAYMKWGYEWKLKAELGDSTALRIGVTRNWAIDATAGRQSRHGMQELMDNSFRLTVQTKDLLRAFELSLIYQYSFWHFNYDFDSEVYELLLFAQLSLQQNDTLLKRLSVELRELPSAEVALIAEFWGQQYTLGQEKQTQLVVECLDKLYERLSRPTSGGEWKKHVEPFLRVLAHPLSGSGEKITHKAIRNRDKMLSTEILAIWSQQARALRNAEAFYEVITDSSFNDLTTEEQNAVLSQAVFLALEENLNLTYLNGLTSTSSPYVILYAYIKGHTLPKFEAFNFPEIAPRNRRQFGRVAPNGGREAIFYLSFFIFLANYIIGKADFNQAWLNKLPHDEPWLLDILTVLNEIARLVVLNINTHLPLSIDSLYQQIEQIEIPELYPSNNDFYYIVETREAFGLIILDLLSISEQKKNISRIELERILSSPYCHKHQWLKALIHQRRAILDSDALSWLYNEEQNDLSKTISYFSERASQCALTACIFALHKLPSECQYFIRRASSNIHSHGEHKDMLFFMILESITHYDEYVKSHNLTNEAPRAWIFKTAPAIEHIRKYTDSDETGALPSELGDVLSIITPDLLYRYYVWLADSDEYFDAQSALHAFVRVADLNNPIHQAIATTAIDNESLKIISKRAEENDEGAKKILLDNLAYLGKEVIVTEKSESTSSPLPVRHHNIQISEYKVTQLSQLLQDLKSRNTSPYDVTKIVNEWFSYWVGLGQKREVYQAVKGIHSPQARFLADLYDQMFEIALEISGKQEAYQWLVLAHVEAHGWERYYTSEDDSKRRVEAVKRHYSDKWEDYLWDTIQYPRESRYRWRLNVTELPRIVKYLLVMEKASLAEQLIEKFISTSLEYISDLTLSTPQWLLENDD